MIATQTLPPTYRPAGTVDVSKNERLLLALNLAGLLIIGIIAWAIFLLLLRVRPRDILSVLPGVQVSSLVEVILLVVILLTLTALYVVIHEAIHGFFFWRFTRVRPRFALHWNYAYAAAPDWFIARVPFLITTLAPLIVISLVGLLLLLLGPPSWILPIGYIVVMNAGGASGDMLVAYRLLRLPGSCLVQDRGDAVTFYVETAPAHPQ